MTKQRVWLLAVVVLVLATSASFYAGKRVGAAKAFEWFVVETEKSDAEDTLGHYVSSRDIAKGLKYGNIAQAKCSADLTASANLDAVKECLAKPSCNSAITLAVSALAPELKAPLSERPFDYITTRNGKKECST